MLRDMYDEPVGINDIRSTIAGSVSVAETSVVTSVSKFLSSLGALMRGNIEDSLGVLNTLNDVYSKHVDLRELRR